MAEWLERVGVALPLAQAGMAGGVAGHRLAAAVSEAGGLGTISTFDPEPMRTELDRARALTGKPLAVNVLLPFARDGHWRVARHADVVVTFWGAPVRRTDKPWIHQCGSLDEMQAARRAGADAVIAQGVEAGGHVRGTTPAHELLERARAALPPDYPILLAGGIAEAADVKRALEAGAAGAVAGTRFLLSDESAAHPEYKRRLLDARQTLLTELFGLGWAAPHRVIPNEATERWLRGDPRGPALIRLTHRLVAPAAARLPQSLAGRMADRQRPVVPLFGPLPPLASSPARLLDAAPLYAGETVKRLGDVRPAGELVRALVDF